MLRHELTDCHFSLADAARYLGKSPRWLQYQLTSSNPPPGYQIPSVNTRSKSIESKKKTWLFKKSELDSWLKQFRASADLDKLVDEVVAEVTK